MWHAQGPSSRKMSLETHEDEQITTDHKNKAMCTHRLILVPGSIGGSNEEIDHHPITHVETVFHRPKKHGKRCQKYPFYTQQQCASDHEINRECVCVCVGLCYFRFEILKNPKKFCFISAVEKGRSINHIHLLQGYSPFCVVLRRICVRVCVP